MPHQCVRCNSFYDDGASEIVHGCKCGGRLFFFVKKEKLEQAKQIAKNLTDEDKVQIEEDVIDLIGDNENDYKPVVLDFESIRISEPGKYELDLVNLFKNDHVIYNIGDGKYMIDIKETLDRYEKKKSKKKVK